MFGTWFFLKPPTAILSALPFRSSWPYFGCLLGSMALMFATQLVVPPSRIGTEAAQRRRPKIPDEIPVGGAVKEKTLMLERPADVLMRYPATRIEWRFANTRPQQVHELLASSGLASAHLAALQDESHWEISHAGVLINPPLIAVVRTTVFRRNRRL